MSVVLSNQLVIGFLWINFGMRWLKATINLIKFCRMENNLFLVDSANVYAYLHTKVFIK